MTKGNMQVRVVSLAVLIAAVFIVLGARLWYLQVLTGQDYTLAARATQHTNIKIPAQRGVIYDRSGKILANNVPGLNVTVIPNEISRDKVKELATAVEADTESVLARYDAAIETGSQYSPILVKENAGLDADSVVGKSGVELSYEEVLRGKAGRRTYNVDALGRIVPEGSRVDSMGRFVDENGEPINANPSQELPDHVTEPVPGKNLQLTVDLDIQRIAEDELEAAIERVREEGYPGRGGAVVAMDPRNGEILALASRPNFDPQLFVGGISGERELRTYQYLGSEASEHPFINRAITAGQPAASTFKTFTGLGGLASGVIDSYTTYTDEGSCWHPAGVTVSPCYQSWRENSPNAAFLGTHGTQNFAEALKDSNDKFFYQVADWIWNSTKDKAWLPHFYERFGFGSLTGIDLPGETEGRVPTEAGERQLAKALGTPEEAYWSVG